MVAEEDEQGGAFTAVHIVGQPAQHPVGVAETLGVGDDRVQILPGQAVGGDGQGDLLLGQGIEGLVVLHGDGEKEGGLLRLVQHLFHQGLERLVGGVAPLVGQLTHLGQLLQGVEGVEAQIGVGTASGVEAGVIGVHGDSAVARRLVVGDVALQGAVHVLIGGGSAGQGLGAQSGENFKLRADRPAADGVGEQSAAVAVVPGAQIIVVGQGVLTEGEAGDLPQIAEALTEYQDHVKALSCGLGPLILRQQPLHVVPGVATGLLKAHAVQVEGEGADKAVFRVVQALEHGELGVDGELGQEGGRAGQAGAEHSAQRDDGGGEKQPVDPPDGQPQLQDGQSGAPEYQHQREQPHPLGQSAAEKGEEGARLLRHQNILGDKGVAVQRQLHVVDKGCQDGQPAQYSAGHGRPAEQEEGDEK